MTTLRRLLVALGLMVAVLAINFTKNLKVESVNNYGVEDGKVFDFSKNETPNWKSTNNR